MNRAVAENVVDRLVDTGARLSGTREQAVEEVHRMVKDDHIPGGKTASEVTRLRAAPPGHRCGLRTGEDIQSGPFYCGEPASLMGNSDGGTVYTCKGHDYILRRLHQETLEGERC